jgi:hypothetical protein
MVLAFLAGVRTKPTVWLARVESEVAALRKDVAGYRAAHQNEIEALDRRLDGLERTAAQAANELRMASEQLIAGRAVDSAGGSGATA